MKKKTFLSIASVLMIAIGILRGLGGISLFLKGNSLETNQRIIANELQIKMVAIGLIIVCILLIYAAVALLWKNTKKAWYISLLVLVLFFINGIINGYLLFGQPVAQGQMINIITVITCSGLLFSGKTALCKNY